MKIGWFGLGEAGSLLTADLIQADVSIVAYDPAEVTTPAGVQRVDDPHRVVLDANVIIAVTQGKEAIGALEQALTSISTEALYADFSTNSPGAKKEMAAIAARYNFQFADIALMSTVLGNGLRTPALVSGDGAEKFIKLFTKLGMPVDYVSEVPGDAALRKLLRSIMMKGLAGTIIEALRAGEKAGCQDWLWENIVTEITQADRQLLLRLVNGTEKHAVRRLHEMEACQAMLEEFDIEPLLTRGTVENLRRIPLEGIPDIRKLSE